MTEAETELLRLFLTYGEGTIPDEVLSTDGDMCNTTTALLLWNGQGSKYLRPKRELGKYCLEISPKGLKIISRLGAKRDRG